MSVTAAKKLLAEFNLPEEKVKKVLNCIEAHHKAIPFTCKEAEICANADCYRFIYPKNVFAFIVKNVAVENMSLENSINFAYYKLEEKHRILSLDVCKKELKGYYQMFKKMFEECNAKPEGR